MFSENTRLICKLVVVLKLVVSFWKRSRYWGTYKRYYWNTQQICQSLLVSAQILANDIIPKVNLALVVPP